MGLIDRFRRPAHLEGAGAAALLDRARGGDGDVPGMTAAVAPVAEGGPSGLAPMSGRRNVDLRSARAAFYARRVGFVRNTYRFLAYQAARPAVFIEFSPDGGATWEKLPPNVDPWAYGILNRIRDPNGSFAELIRRGVFLDDTVGEFYIIDVTEGDRPAFVVRNVNAVSKTKRGTYIVKESENARKADGPKAVIEVDEKRVYRHWQPDEEWETMATSSLMGLVDDLDTMWTLYRQLRRESRSRLAMNNLFWSPTEAHAETKDVGGQKVSVFNLSYAQMAANAINDLDDSNVASVAPQSVNSPGNLNVPRIIEIPSLGPDLLQYIVDARNVVAAGLPLSSQSVFDAQVSENHWSDWLADEKDLQTIGERLRRVLDSWTKAVLRPSLEIGQRYGAWDGGDTTMFRIGYDEDALRRTLDNSENVKWAWTNALIRNDVALEQLHLDPGDYLTDEDYDAEMDRRKKLTEATKGPAPGGPPPGAPADAGGAPGPLALPTAPKALRAGGPVPNGGEMPAATAAAHQAIDQETAGVIARALAAFDDRWILDG